MSDRSTRTTRLDAMEARLTGPKRIGLFGHRNVGKTTLLAIFYRQAANGRIPGLRMAAVDPHSAEDLAEKIAYMLELRASNNDVVEPYAKKFPGSQFFAGKKPWEVKVDIAMPCATQNELDGEDARKLLANGVKVVAEVSNMGCRPEAIDAFIAAKIPYGPGKAVNAGGVATSGLEMTQNAQKLNWTAEEVDAKLHQIMSSIHHACLEYGTEKDGYINYMKGANIAGFMKVAKSMVEQGVL